MSTVPRLIANCVAAVLLSSGVYYVLAIFEAYTLVWTGGGVPSLLVSNGWGSIASFFIYDLLRFCLLSFLAVWPVTFLKPQKPVLYSLLLVIFMVMWFQYWEHLTSWTTLPTRYHWVPWLILIHVLSVPAMYQLHRKLRSRHNKSLNAVAHSVGAG